MSDELIRLDDALKIVAAADSRTIIAIAALPVVDVKELVEAAKAMRSAVCGPDGFAEAVRHITGLALPWPALDAAEERLNATLAAFEKEVSK